MKNQTITTDVRCLNPSCDKLLAKRLGRPNHTGVVKRDQHEALAIKCVRCGVINVVTVRLD